MRTHVVKCWSDYWDAIECGDKPFDVRRDDRGYQKGDLLALDLYDRKTNRYVMDGPGFSAKPRRMERKISYILTGGQFGIELGYVVLGLQSTVNPSVSTKGE